MRPGDLHRPRRGLDGAGRDLVRRRQPRPGDSDDGQRGGGRGRTRMAIVTISQQVGTGGAEIGLALAERLGYCFVDHERFLERTQRYGLDAHRLWHLEEEPPSLFERFDHETRRYISVIQTVLFEIAAEDRAVVVGRGGQWLLRDVPHAVRLRVMAPTAFRVDELTSALSSHGGERMSAQLAGQLVHRDDTQKLKRMRYLFNVDLNDPALYHLVS